MALNYIWVAFFIIAFLVALARLVFYFLSSNPNPEDLAVFPAIITNAFDIAKVAAFDIALGLIGVLTLWMGLMKIGERSGVVSILAKIIGPFFNRLFPEVPKDHPVIGQILMNFSANMLGLDNAATPLGLKAMQGLQELNPNKDTASNAQIMFLVLNTAGFTLIPVTIMVYRARMGAADPSDVFIPILITTFFAAVSGITVVSIYQKINLLFDKIFLAYFAVIAALIAGIIYYFTSLPEAKMQVVSKLASNFFIYTLIVSFVGLAVYKKINVFESFIEGAKEGFDVAIRIIPYLVAMLVGASVFRSCGALDYINNGIGSLVRYMGLDDSFVPALPTAFMKPLSGSGARGMMLDIMKTHGADSFAGRLSSIFQGACDTTFYIVAVYFGSVGIKKTRYAVTCGLLADLGGVLAAIWVAYKFFPPH